MSHPIQARAALLCRGLHTRPLLAVIQHEHLASTASNVSLNFYIYQLDVIHGSDES